MKVSKFEVSKFDLSASVFARPYVVEQSRTLNSGVVATPQALAPGRYLFQSPLGPQAHWWKEDLKGQGVHAPKAAEPVTFGHLVKTLTAGGSFAAPPLMMARLPNTISHQELAQFFVTNNFTPDSADSLASTALDFAKSTFGKTILLGLAGGAVTIAMVEAVRPNWSLTLKGLCGLGGAALAGAVYLVLKWLGIMT